MKPFDLHRIRTESGIGTLEFHEQLGSTNDLALERVRSIPNSLSMDHLPLLILTERQTAGRGQHLRTWDSETGNLTCSLCMAIGWGQAQTLIPLAVGLAVCEAIESITSTSGIKLQLKWPNDVLWGEKKLGGILIERVAQSSGMGLQGSVTIIGIGVNVNRPITLVPTENSLMTEPTKLHLKPVSLFEILGRKVDLTEFTIALIRHVLSWLALLDSDPRGILDRCDRRMVFRDREIELTLPDRQKVRGRYAGLSDLGELLLDGNGERMAFASAAAIRW